MKCFPSEAAYRLWRLSASPTLAPCRDCNPAQQAAMRARGRCEHPEAVFVVEKGELVGKLPGAQGALISRVRVECVSVAESMFVVRIGARLLGPAALAELVGVSEASLPHYRGGQRVLPEEKFKVLRAAVRRGAGLILA
jgi:hypothetical protein